jgi:hypothetical protein
MRWLKFIVPAAALAAGLMATSAPSLATPPIAKKEGNAKCTTCHTGAGKKELNKTGKCYKTSHNLATCSTGK